MKTVEEILKKIDNDLNLNILTFMEKSISEKTIVAFAKYVVLKDLKAFIES